MCGTWGLGVSVVAELKRRNVVRVAVLYGLAAWLILQVADVLVPALGLPDWVMRFVALLLILGFPLVLIFSWVYELTPEGLKKQHEVDLNQSITHETGRKINYLIGALAVLAIVWWPSSGSSHAQHPSRPQPRQRQQRRLRRHRSRQRPSRSRCCRSRT